MNMFFVAILSVALSVAAQFSLKAGMSGERAREAMAQPYPLQLILTILTDRYLLGGFLLYGAGAVIWLRVLSKADVSKAYPLVGLGFVMTAAVGFMVGEHVTLPRLTGVALICAGVFLVGRS